MAGIKFPRKEFEKFVKINKEIEEKLSMFGTHFESLSDDEIELEITPNRPDLYSLQGFMRSFLNFIGKTKPKQYKIEKSDAKITVEKGLEKIRPYSMAVIVKGIKFTDEKIKEIMQWQEKMHGTLGRNRKKVAIGYYDLSKIKFPVKYLAKAPKEIIFEPLEMTEKMDALKILQRHPTGREYAPQLAGLDKFPVYYDENNEVLSMPPIINSNHSGKILPGVSDVLIECSGTDLNTLKKAMTIAAADLIDAGGTAYQVEVIYGSKKESIDFTPEKLKLSLENVNKLSGLNLAEKDIKPLLEKMGHAYSNGVVEVSPWRVDILHEVDLIEDIIIAYGYDKIEPVIPQISTIGKENKSTTIKRKISEVLVGLGLLEISSFHLIKKDESKRFQITNVIEVEESKTDYKVLRPTLQIPLLRIIGENVDNEYPQNVFEIGRVFNKDVQGKTETGIKEEERLIVSLAPGNFTQIKQILEALAKSLDLEFTLKVSDEDHFIDGRCGKVLLNNTEIGVIGEAAPSTLKTWKHKMPLALFEISLDDIFKRFG